MFGSVSATAPMGGGISTSNQDCSDPEIAVWRRDLLPRLVGLPLLPIGAGSDGKAPVDPTTGKGLKGWQTAAWTPEQIDATAPGIVTAVGMRCGPDAGRLVCFDLDGQSAIGAAIAAGCEWSASWAITRPTAADRMKVVFRVPPEVEPPSTGKVILPTGDGEQIEAFWGTGQVVVTGLHRPSGAFLEWQGGPESIQPLPAAWLALWQRCNDKPAAATTNRGGSSRSGWQPAVPCPICGRQKDNDCQISNDGQTVLCHHGKTHEPPAMRKGQTITIGGTVWAYCGDTANAIGPCSVFRIHTDRQPQRPKLQVVPDRPGSSEPPEPTVLDDPGSSEPPLSDLFPDRLAAALKNRCRYLPAGPAAIAVTFLAGVAGCVKLGTRVVGSEAAGFNVPATLFTAVVAPSGHKKSPLGTLVITEPTTPIREDLREQTNRAMQAWRDRQKGEGKGKPKAPPEPPPRPMVLTVSEVTGEGLAVQLAAHESRGVGLLIHRDEIAGLIGGLNQYKGNGKGNDQQQLLEAFDGRGSVALRVKSDAPRACERCQLAIHGGIQPAILRKLVDRGDDSGLWARFLFAPLPAVVVPLPPDDPEQTQISNDAAQVLTEVVGEAYRLPPRTYRLDSAAAERFRVFETDQQRRVHGTEVDAVSAIAGKAAGKVLRVAVLLHVIAIAAGVTDRGADVPLERIEGGISLVTYCDGWVAGMHEAAAAGDDLDAGALVLKLAGQRCVGWNNLKHRLSHKQRLILPNAAAFEAEVRQLAADGGGVVTTGPRGGVRFQATP